MLARPYAIAGQVIAGERLGRKIGFPTANLDTTGLALPPHGVYAGWVRVLDQPRSAVMNIGFRPTLNQPKPELRVEVHVLDFSDDLYGRELEFEFVSRLRGEEKFGSLTALGEQIQSDLAAARQLLNATGARP
jgi:riboflavin kinase/FMN adenylyltransferase